MVSKKNKMNTIKKIKSQSLTRFLLLIAIIVFINIFSQYYFKRFDLTEDNRYSLSNSTKEIIKSLEDVVYVKIYLEGDLPAGFRKLKESTKEMLDEMIAVENKNIEYQFINPFESVNLKEKDEIIRQLSIKGLEAVNLEVMEDNRKIQKIIFPSALISYRNHELPLKLLKQQIGVSSQQQLHNSIVGLEFGIISTIKKLTTVDRKNIAFISGHGELNKDETIDIFNTLSHQYNVKRINLPKYKVGILDKFDLIIIAKPDSTFSELEKYKIDQFVVKGGKVIWFVDKLLAEIDSLARTGVTSTLDYPLNLNDMFFKYGIRFNNNLVQDINCHLIPVMTTKGQPQRDFRPWTFYPIAFPTSEHPIVNNLNAIWFRFANSIDTIGSNKIKKTVLLQSSDKSKYVNHIARISLQQINEPINPNLFYKGPQTLAVLVEGKFTSLFKNRIPRKLLESGQYGEFVEKDKGTKMIFVSDGDIIRNQISRVKEEKYPLGYDRFANQTFGNKNFALNAVDYLLDGSGIINLRTKQFKLRILNKTKIKEQKLKWQIINLVLPIIFLIFFGLIYNILKKRRYTK